MELQNLIPEINLNLVHLLYTLVEIDTEDSTSNQKLKDRNISIFNNLHENLVILNFHKLRIQNEYYKILKSLDSNEPVINNKNDYITKVINCNYKVLFTEASDRLPEVEFNYNVHAPLYNNIVLFLQYLSPNDFIWHYHTPNNPDYDEKILICCCKFSETSINDLLSHYHVASVIFMSISQLYGYNDDYLLNLGELSRYLEKVVPKINGIITLINLPLKNNMRLDTSKSHNCSLENSKQIDVDLYNKSNSHYNLYPTPSKLALTGCRVICKCYMNLLSLVENISLKLYNHLISTLLIIYNKTCGMILDDIYDLVMYISNNRTEGILRELKNFLALKDNSNLLLFKEVANKMAEDVNNYNSSVLKCLECYIRLTSLVYNDKDIKSYELVETLIDRIILMNKAEINEKFMENYKLYLKNAPLVCAATMLQTMELTFGCIDSLEPKIVMISLKFLEDLFEYLPNDCMYYFQDCYSRFILIYVKYLSNEGNFEDSLNNLEKLNLYNNLIVKLLVTPHQKRHVLDDVQRNQIIYLMKNVLEIIKKQLGESTLNDLIFKINSDVKNDPNSSDRTLAIFEKISILFQP
ncbi:uncharacterized protein TA05045 [Theileria annulata]|uniref:Uncharacterized protein n=1 Tax=Theileria annulata TaxID=5874 RepID=Q4UBQ5_THEAN|nr:uncharacterized protein TA05045 [Theileria annulata]CAI75746.1 hypothetical protein TA05045 [Theileria annulata]|eukprot:XP_955222.1 hypothetical protein TA05045 [Theileria annulata]